MLKLILLSLVACSLTVYSLSMHLQTIELKEELRKTREYMNDAVSDAYQDCKRMQAVQSDMDRRNGCWDALTYVCNESSTCLQKYQKACLSLGD